ncbi:DUF1657 domain-containing protein [Bacillaceae bacterium Marseille-Q3522]|nr:DUF1657 domain-containing protein [Bacillaceae bacterium Marseille-Q3522]
MTVVSDVKQCLAMIKGIEAQLSMFALNSQDGSAQKQFHESMLVITDIKKDLEARITELQMEEPQYKNS